MKRGPLTRSCCDSHPRRVPGCRPCMDRAARWQKQYEYETSHGLTRKLPSAPYVEMIGRLNANGWPGHVIARKIGWEAPFLTCSSIARRPHLTVSLAQRIEKVVRELADFPGPSNITRCRALASGYTPYCDRPLDPDPVIDEVAITRYLDGDTTVPLSEAERDAAVLILRREGVTPSRIVVLLHMNFQRVNRVLAGVQPKKRGPKKQQAA